MPFMRVTRSRFDPAKAEELARLGPDLTAAIRRLPGLQHLHGGIDREGGRGITVAIFDTREHAGYSPETLGPILVNMQSLGLQIESREVYEVTGDAE